MIYISSETDSRNFPGRLLRGPTANSLRVLGLVLSLFCLACMVGGAVIVLLRAPEEVLAWTVIGMLTSTPLMVTAVGAFALAVWRESRAGYTTLEGKLRHLPWVDVRTGKVLRAAGAPFCSARARA